MVLKAATSKWLRRWFAKNWRTPNAEKWLGFLYSLIHARENNSFDPALNGEFALLDALKSCHAQVMFDVGANVGDWSSEAARKLPSAAIHAFEIVPATFNELQKNLASLGTVSLVQRGLSDRAGSVSVQCYEGSALATLYAYPDRTAIATVEAEVIAGDDYCEAHGIERIDFLKLDVEGAELRVLQGLSFMLKQGRIRAIQFEYALLNEIISISLYRYYQLLEPLGFEIGKLHADGVEFLPFERMAQGLRFGNFVAVLKSDQALKRALLRF